LYILLHDSGRYGCLRLVVFPRFNPRQDSPGHVEPLPLVSASSNESIVDLDSDKSKAQPQRVFGDYFLNMTLMMLRTLLNSRSAMPSMLVLQRVTLANRVLDNNSCVSGSASFVYLGLPCFSLNAMHNASKNASDMIGILQMKYNRGRQAAITNKLVDIITGMSPCSLVGFFIHINLPLGASAL
jgi:hypothetical protein